MIKPSCKKGGVVVFTIKAMTWNNKELIIRDEMPQKDSDEIKGLLSDIDDVIAHSIKSQMVIENTNDFLKCLNALRPGKGINFVDVNRHLENVINSFYSWTEFTEKHYKDIFAGIRSGFYDNNLEYRSMFELRTCTTHKMLPIHCITFLLDQDGKAKIEIEPQFILEHGNMKKDKTFYKELQMMKQEEQKIDIEKIIMAMNMNMPEYEKTLLKAINPSIAPRVEALTNNWPSDVNLVVMYDEQGKPVTGNLIAPVNEYHKVLNDYKIAWGVA